MSIKTIKLDNGEIFKYDENSPLFNSYKNAITEINPSLRQDDSFFGARQLEYLRQKIYQPAYSELKFLNGGLIPMNTAIPDGVDVDSYDVINGAGEASVISDWADDIKTVEITGENIAGKIKSIADSYTYSVQDLRKDKLLGSIGKSVVENKAMIARKVIDEKLDKMLRIGDDKHGIKGLLNADGVPSTAAAATGSGSTTTFATKTAANILADFTKALEDMGDDTNGNEIPDTCLIDYKNWLLIKNKALDTTMYSGMSVLKYIEQEYGLKVIWVQQFKNAFIDNTKSGFVLYKNDISKLEGVMPIRLLAHPPQIKNLATKNILEARCGGVRVFYPKSVSITTGI
jgi:hypothetical protein